MLPLHLIVAASVGWLERQQHNLIEFLREENRVLNRLLICDRDRKWSAAVERFLATGGVRLIRTPFLAPNCNAHAERFVRSINEECLNRVIPLGEGHPRRTIAEFVAHYHNERNHQGLDNELIDRPRRQHTGGPFAGARASADFSTTTEPPPEGGTSSRTLRQALNRARLVCSVAIVWVVWFASTSWRRKQVFAPYRENRGRNTVIGCKTDERVRHRTVNTTSSKRFMPAPPSEPAS